MSRFLDLINGKPAVAPVLTAAPLVAKKVESKKETTSIKKKK